MPTEEVKGNTIEISLGNGTKLVAQSNIADPDYKEIYVFLKGEDGLIKQDLAIVGQKYRYENNSDTEYGDEVVGVEGVFTVCVYADETREDYTHDFEVKEYREEEEDEASTV